MPGSAHYVSFVVVTSLPLSLNSFPADLQRSQPGRGNASPVRTGQARLLSLPDHLLSILENWEGVSPAGF